MRPDFPGSSFRSGYALPSPRPRKITLTLIVAQHSRGRAGPNLLAMILFNKFGLHQPLNRQSETYAAEGMSISVSTLADYDKKPSLSGCWYGRE